MGRRKTIQCVISIIVLIDGLYDVKRRRSSSWERMEMDCHDSSPTGNKVRMDDLSNADLLAAWRRGDQEAFAVLVTRHHGLVHAACLRQAAPGEVDDCVQAVFLVFSRRPASAARSPSLAAWLQRVASFVCRHSRRAAMRRRRAERVAGQVSAPVSAGPLPEALGHLDDCLLRLPSKQRQALVMHFLTGESIEAVATSLDTSRNNASQLISRGLAALRVLLSRRGVAMGTAALAGLLATEAQAATGPASSTAIVKLTAGSPSPVVTALAAKARAAMIFGTAIPFFAAAGLILAAGGLSLALTAEPAARPLPPPPLPAARGVPLADRLVDLDLEDADAVEIVRQMKQQGIDVRGKLPDVLLTVKVTGIKLGRLMEMIGCAWHEEDGHVVIDEGRP
jgi:RNA polymerase sigma-70 factor (ECF subfamily)